MKRLVSLALSAALVLSLLAGCGNSTDPQTTGTATTGGNEGTGEAKDTIVWAQSGDINSLDFHVGKQYLSYGVTCNIFDTLVSWDADNNVIPMLATEWEFLDEDSIQFKLREGVTFHDGEPLYRGGCEVHLRAGAGSHHREEQLLLAGVCGRGGRLHRGHQHHRRLLPRA